MKFNIRKISAIGASLLMAGMTAGFAAAANYPAPFVSGGTADVAIVYGSGSGVSNLDFVEASNIKEDLQAELGGTSSITSSSVDDESVLLEKSADKLNLGNNAATVFVSTVNDDDLPTLLADGTYTDDENTEFDFTQKVTLGSNLGVEHFQDSDYDDETPSVGIKMSDDEHVLNYTLDFTTHPYYSAPYLETTTMTMMGKEYYVLDVINGTTNKTTFLDAADSGIVSDGVASTISGKSVSITYIASAEVKVEVDGQTSNSLAEGSTFKLSDGTYVGIKDIMYDAKEAGVSQVELSIGSGKLEISHGAAIELNDDTIQEVIGFLVMDSVSKLNKVVLQWTTDDEEFIGSEGSLLMPGFEALQVTWGGFIIPSSEDTIVQNSGSDVMELKTYIEDGFVTIPLIYANSSGDFEAIGKDSSNRLVTTPSNFIFLNRTAGDKYFVASYNSSTEGESYYLEFDITTQDNIAKLYVRNVVTGEDEYIINASTYEPGNVVLTVDNITDDGSKEWANVSINSGGSFHELYTAGGLEVFLPYFNITAYGGAAGELNYEGNGSFVSHGNYNGTLANTAGHGFLSFYVFFDEEDKDETLGAGNLFNITLTESGSTGKVHVNDVDTGGGEYEIGDTDDYETYAVSDLATKMIYDTGGDQDWVTITYAGDQSYAELYLTAPGATATTTVVGGEASLGEYLIKDTEVSSMSTKNLIVVGGSCINSAAAALVGGAYCSADWTTATGIGTGQFLIKGYASSSITSKIALLVAGYEAADTVNAATYLRTTTVDTSKEYKGTSSTSAELVVE